MLYAVKTSQVPAFDIRGNNPTVVQEVSSLPGELLRFFPGSWYVAESTGKSYHPTYVGGKKFHLVHLGGLYIIFLSTVHLVLVHLSCQRLFCLHQWMSISKLLGFKFLLIIYILDDLLFKQTWLYYLFNSLAMELEC